MLTLDVAVADKALGSRGEGDFHGRRFKRQQVVIVDRLDSPTRWDRARSDLLKRVGISKRSAGKSYARLLIQYRGWEE
jgi:hypothetical protein